MRFIIVQKDINERNYEPYLEYAKARGVDLICFGELGTSGCLYTPRQVEPLEQVVAKFSPYPFAVITGVPRLVNGAMRNSLLFHHRGNLQFYDKINLFPGMNEPSVYQPGDEPTVWPTPWGKFGVSICYDIRFPEIYDKQKWLGADTFIIPAAFPLARIADWRQLLIERAKEHRVTVIGINAVGNDGTNVFGGTSMVVSADGMILAEADQRTPSMLEISL